MSKLRYECTLTEEEIQDIFNGRTIIFDTEDEFQIAVRKEKPDEDQTL